MNVNDLVIRQADLCDPDDQRAIVALTLAYAQDPMGGCETLGQEVQNRLISGLQAMPTTLIFLAYIDNQPIGIATCFLGFTTFLAKQLINVHDLAVLPDYRGRGIGRKLLEAVEMKGIELECGKLTLEVQSENVIAQRTYQQAGFNNGKCGDLSGRVYFFVKYL
jgi:ribosomal protein S18 acetylase RimI-like enzyme